VAQPQSALVKVFPLDDELWQSSNSVRYPARFI
jgi:hypothetical protein